MFIDTARIKVEAGYGGNGVNSFYRDKLTRAGHPDGGDGGSGGSVILRVSTNVHTLLDFQYRQHFKAQDGKHGSSKKKKGAAGKDSIVLAPMGTLVFDNDANTLLADLTKDNEELVIAKGGEGGKGNRSHKDATPGSEGEDKNIRLELKLIADVGIIGFPNAGKSTLISKISKAHPKIASYPFTTTAPVLGVVKLDDFEFKIAEVPGLIEGAYKGKGLGDLFLRHIERTKLLVHLIDVGENPRNPFTDYKNINEELRLYGKGLIKKNKILAANKIDVEGAEKNIEMLKEKINPVRNTNSSKKGISNGVKQKIFPISSKMGTGIPALIDEICNRLKQINNSEKENAKE